MVFVAQRRHYLAVEGSIEERVGAWAALNRVHALACIVGAGHGWLGASFSVTELLSVLYFGVVEDAVVLSKGHAAAAQYACLYGRGMLDAAALRSYKDGPAGLQAHSDRRTPGVLLSSGSLGQALSQTAALARLQPERRFFVVLGDGELQEGQNWEGLQTVLQQGLANLQVIVDANGLQTARAVAEVKGLAHLDRCLAGMGFEVAEVDGHSARELMGALATRPERPQVLISRSVKAGGSPCLAALGELGRWHGEVPDAALYQRLLDEQVALCGCPGVAEELAEWRRGPGRRFEVVRPAKRAGSTGEAFARRLRERAVSDERLVLLDADLAAPCGLGGLGQGDLGGRFVEMGIAEQDMVSFAGGLAVGGKLPVVNSYAAFLRRGLEQVCLNLAMGARAIYAGHYAGASYYTDGKTHQCLNDLGLWRALPELWVVDPVDERRCERLLDAALTEATPSLYFRLRRSGEGLDVALADVEPWGGADAGEGGLAEWTRPLVLGRPPFAGLLLALGPVATGLALDALEKLPGWGLVVPQVLGPPPDLALWGELLAGCERVVSVEDGNRGGGLASWAAELLAALGAASGARLASLSMEGFGPSFRSFEACAAHHGFTLERLLALAR